MNLNENELKQYFQEWIEYTRQCDDESMPADGFDTWLTDTVAQNAIRDELDESEGFQPDHDGYGEPEVDTQALAKAVVDALPEPELIPEDNRKEVLTLRDNMGRLIGKYEMTRREFLETMKPLFEVVELSKKDMTTYRAW